MQQHFHEMFGAQSMLNTVITVHRDDWTPVTTSVRELSNLSWNKRLDAWRECNENIKYLFEIDV